MHLLKNSPFEMIVVLEDPGDHSKPAAHTQSKPSLFALKENAFKRNRSKYNCFFTKSPHVQIQL